MSMRIIICNMEISLVTLILPENHFFFRKHDVSIIISKNQL